jgi:uncharacterized protein (TIGR02453 family)
MDTAVFPEAAFTFYEGLRADNSKAYWTTHKDVYDEAVRAPMRTLLEALAPEFGATPVLFRPYRDIRFSKDKTPYKTAQGGFLELAPGVGYYLQVDADGVRVGGGFHAHDRHQTTRWRAAVDSPTAGPALVELVDALEKAGFEIGGTQVRTRPRGVPPDHPRLDLMRREFLTAARPADPATRTTIRAGYDELRPLGRTLFKSPADLRWQRPSPEPRPVRRPVSNSVRRLDRHERSAPP